MIKGVAGGIPAPGDPTAASQMYELLRLRPGAYSAVAPDGELYLLAWPHGESFGRLDADARAFLRRLAQGPCQSWEPDLAWLVDRLRVGGWLTVTVTDGGDRPFYTVRPLGPPPPERLDPGDTVVLSRFAILRRDGDDMLLTCPRAWCEIRLHDPRLLCVLGGATSMLPAALADRMLRDVVACGFAASGAEHAELRLAQWSPADLWFHASSRLGGHAPGTVGATFWAKGRFDPLPERHAPFPGPVVPLHRPDLAAVRDPPLTEVLESRRSIREHDDAVPLSVEQLGEFLYRCAGARRLPGAESFARPYPSGGALYELELYPIVHRVSGLDPGLYHYDPYDHQLVRVAAPDSAVGRLLTVASWSTARSTPPQVLIVISARFGRLMWKYENMAYAAVLKHVGVLFQTMYAVATAMGLAPCAIGSGDSDAFAVATGLDRFAESSVGEFMLGSRIHRTGDATTAT